ncbi:MAG: hypothetical protein V4702_05140 [Patescibacteria group bacterium]
MANTELPTPDKQVPRFFQELDEAESRQELPKNALVMQGDTPTMLAQGQETRALSLATLEESANPSSTPIPPDVLGNGYRVPVPNDTQAS